MKLKAYITGLHAALFAILLAVSPAGSGSMMLTGVGTPTVATGPFVGVGDAVSGATAFYGLTGYNAAYATGSNPSAIVCDTATFLTCSTINILANGNFDTATASGSSACAVACVVKQLFEQVSGSIHAVCTSAATCPTLTFNCLGTKPCMTFAGAQVLSTAPFGVTQPLTLGGIADRTNAADGGVIASSVANDAELRFGPTTANQIFVYAGSATVTKAATDSSFHALNGTFNGTSSVMNVDGTSSGTGTNPGSGNITAINIGLNNTSFNSFLTGKITNVWVYPSALSGANMTAISSNQHTYWGF